VILDLLAGSLYGIYPEQTFPEMATMDCRTTEENQSVTGEEHLPIGVDEFLEEKEKATADSAAPTAY
jgi:hypothetical protein